MHFQLVIKIVHKTLHFFTTSKINLAENIKHSKFPHDDGESSPILRTTIFPTLITLLTIYTHNYLLNRVHT